ncbi:hypothetical protein [Actinoplanes sp. RD1]|uniref:hypothetical protein n=1 Tax=Actinoplanes sp. RD1 TaxID=3064538 RepID=UPI00274218D9|nr:hypothetical protein [Actinoplanes sp. RD1]
MTASRFRRSSALALAGLTLGAVMLPGAALADGPGYGGTADALTVQWQESSSDLAVYAVGFRGGSTVQLQVGSLDDSTVAADVSGALRVLVVSASSAVQEAADTTVLRVTGSAGPGTSILVTGQTPAGSLRTLVGAVPPASSATGASDLIPWAVAAAALTAGAVWLAAHRKKPGRHRPGRHRMA